MSRDVTDRATKAKQLPIDELIDACVWGSIDRLRKEHKAELSTVRNAKLLIDCINGRMIEWTIGQAAFAAALFELEPVVRNSTQWLSIEREAYAIAERTLEQFKR